jgi:signal transduction histidine kinase
MKNRTANLNAVTTGNDGDILVGTDNGVIRYNAILDEVKHRPIPAIESVRLPDKSINATGEDLTFRHNQNHVTINYRGFWYEDPENVSYEYILENYDLRWIVSTDRTVVYSNLPPGEYTFKVRASDDGTFTDARIASFRFTILPPFWQTWWFYCIVILSVAGIVYTYVRQRERSLIRDKEILEAKVHERTLEIQKNNEEIQAQNEEIQSQAEEILGINENLEELVKQRTQELERKNKALEEYAFINAHELRAPLASILGLIDLISKTELNDECKTIVSHMEGSAERLDAIVRSITKAIERGEEPTFRKD